MAIGSINGKIKTSFNFKPLKELQRKSPAAFKTAMKRGAIQFLTWCNTGSAKESRKPPIRWGVLRGSSSAFVGNELVKIYEQVIKTGADEKPTPAQSHSAADLVVTWVWNTVYAAKMHETKYNPGPFSSQDGNAGPKWLERHLKADKQDLYAMIRKEFQKETGIA
jgi:hypothetical protein